MCRNSSLTEAHPFFKDSQSPGKPEFIIRASWTNAVWCATLLLTACVDNRQQHAWRQRQVAVYAQSSEPSRSRSGSILCCLLITVQVVEVQKQLIGRTLRKFETHSMDLSATRVSALTAAPMGHASAAFVTPEPRRSPNPCSCAGRGPVLSQNCQMSECSQSLTLCPLWEDR